MTAETAAMAADSGDQSGDVLGSLTQIVQDQRRINILLTRLVRDQDQRIKALEEGGGVSVSSSAQAARPTLEIGKDVPAYPIGDLEFLKKSEVFGGLSDDALRVLYFKGELRKLSSGEGLFEIGSARGHQDRRHRDRATGRRSQRDEDCCVFHELGLNRREPDRDAVAAPVAGSRTRTGRDIPASS